MTLGEIGGTLDINFPVNYAIAAYAAADDMMEVRDANKWDVALLYPTFAVEYTIKNVSRVWILGPVAVCVSIKISVDQSSRSCVLKKTMRGHYYFKIGWRA